MTSFVALLRAVNVGGTGKLPMSDLKQLCESAGFLSVRTYIASGNVVFTSDRTAAEVKAALETALRTYAGKAVDVLVRTSVEMKAVLVDNPFPDAEANRIVAIFLDAPPTPETLGAISGRTNEEIELGRREVYVHYRDGIGRSKLKIPTAEAGTGRNMNTVAKLVELAGQNDTAGGGKRGKR